MSKDDPRVSVSSGGGSSAIDGRQPYNIIFVGDFGASSAGRLTDINKDNFADVMKQADVRLAVGLKNPLGGAGEWEFELPLSSLKQFEPAGLLANIPGARWRLGLREKLMARRAGEISQDEADQAIDAAAGADPSLSWLRAPAPSSGAPTAGSVAPGGGSVLDLVDEPDPSKRISADVARLASGGAESSAQLKSGEITSLDANLKRLNLELGTIVDAALKHPGLRKLETAWRSLKFLVDRVDFREGVRAAMLHTTRDEATNHFINAVVNPAFDGEIPTPGLVIFDFAIANTPPDIEMLDTLAQHAASLPVPLTFPLAPQFFDVKSLRLLKNLPNLVGLMDGFPFAKWKSLRDQRYARALVPVLGSFLLRAPHAASAKGREFTFDEKTGAIGDLLWGGGEIGLAICAARAFARHGWPTRMFGAESGRVEDLPIVPNPNDPQSPWGPGDLSLPERRVDELPAVGINALLSVAGKDSCQLSGGVTAARPIATQETSKQDASLEISLPYQQFSNIASAFLCDLAPKLRGLPAEEVQQKVLFGLAGLLRVAKAEDMEAVQVGVAENPQNAAQTLVQVRIKPPGTIVPGGLHIDFGFAI